jgi:hypothetical protein
MQRGKGEDLNQTGEGLEESCLRIGAGGALIRRWAAPYAQPSSSSSIALALLRSAVSKPSVNQL